MTATSKYRFLYVVWGFLECFLFGGLLYGWGSLVFILKEDGVFSDMCEDSWQVNSTVFESNISTEKPHAFSSDSKSDSLGYIISTTSRNNISTTDHENSARTATCQERDNRLTLAFTVGSMLYCAGTAGVGQINFKFGTRVTRLCALVCFTAGALLVGFTSQDIPWLIFPGLTLLGLGGIPILMTNIQFSNLFTKGSSTVVALFIGAFDASSGVFLIVKEVHEKGVALKWSMVVITAAYLLTLVNSFFFLPRGFIRKPLAESVELSVDDAGHELIVKKKQNISGKGQKDEELAFKLQTDNRKQVLPTVMSCIFSPVYILHVMWLSILQLRFFYFISSLNTWLNALLPSNEEVSFYTNVAMYALMCGLLTSPLAGVVYDFNKRFYRKSRSSLHRNLMPAVLPLALTSLLGIVLSVLVLFNSVSVLYPSFIFNTLFRSFIYSIGTAFLSVMFPSEYFGILYGVMIIFSGIFSLVQYGLASWAEASGYSVVNIFLIVSLATSLVHPLYQWFVCRRAEKRANREAEN